MIIAMVQTKHRHGLVNLRVPRETIQQLLKAEQRNTSLIDDPWPKVRMYKFLAPTNIFSPDKLVELTIKLVPKLAIDFIFVPKVLKTLPRFLKLANISQVIPLEKLV